MTRALSTLAASAVAGSLIWVAAQLHRDSTGGYWAFLGVLAGAGLALALARLPDTGVRTLVPSLPAFALAFLPTLVAAGWVIVATQPHGNWFRRHVLAWSGDIGVTRVVRDLGPFAAVLALGVGVVLGLVFERRVVVAGAMAEAAPAPPTVPAARPATPWSADQQATEERLDRELSVH